MLPQRHDGTVCDGMTGSSAPVSYCQAILDEPVVDLEVVRPADGHLPHGITVAIPFKPCQSRQQNETTPLLRPLKGRRCSAHERALRLYWSVAFVSHRTLDCPTLACSSSVTF